MQHPHTEAQLSKRKPGLSPRLSDRKSKVSALSHLWHKTDKPEHVQMGFLEALKTNCNSPGTTARSTWGRQKACPLSIPCIPSGPPACFFASRTAALPTTPEPTNEEVWFRRSLETRESLHRLRTTPRLKNPPGHPPRAAWWCGRRRVSSCEGGCYVWTKRGFPGPQSAQSVRCWTDKHTAQLEVI